MFEEVAFQFLEPPKSFHLRLPNTNSVVVQGHFLPSGDWWISTAVWHLFYGIQAMNRDFTSSCEASGLDPSSPLCHSIPDVPAVCSDLDWHLSFPLQCPCRVCQTHTSPIHLSLDSAGLPSGCLSTLGETAEFEFWLWRLSEIYIKWIWLIYLL